MRRPAHRFVYMARNSDGSLTAGVTADAPDHAVKRQKTMRTSGKEHHPNTGFVAYVEEYMNEADAKHRAETIARMPRSGKEALIFDDSLSRLTSTNE